MGRIFGTDGARGIASKDLTAELAMNIGKAAALVVEERTNKKPKFLIGKDTRISSDMLESAVCAGLCSVGADALIVGVVPTPAVAYLIKYYGADAGIMLSASHNPFEYNGIKLFGASGFKLSDAEEQEIEEIILDNIKPYSVKHGADIGTVTRLDNAHTEYVKHLIDTVDTKLSGIKIALDCSNGSASATALELFSALDADFTMINHKPNGININDRCGSTHTEILAKYVVDNSCDIGLAFDGDADRCLAVDEKGELIDGDMMLAIFGKHLKEHGKLKDNTIVATVMSNLGFFAFSKDHNINTAVTAVGDRYVLENMLQNGYIIGGEQSGHVIFLEHMTTGDGQLSGIQLLSVMKKTGKKLSELKSVMKKYPQVLVNVHVTNEIKSTYNDNEAVQAIIKKHGDTLADKGRILVRASGTEPLVRVMIEGEDLNAIEIIANEIADVIASLSKVQI